MNVLPSGNVGSAGRRESIYVQNMWSNSWRTQRFGLHEHKQKRNAQQQPLSLKLVAPLLYNRRFPHFFRLDVRCLPTHYTFSRAFFLLDVFARLPSSTRFRTELFFTFFPLSLLYPVACSPPLTVDYNTKYASTSSSHLVRLHNNRVLPSLTKAVRSDTSLTEEGTLFRYIA